MGPIQNLHEAISWLRRRWRIIAMFVMLGAVFGVLTALQSQRIYSANAVIQVINPVIDVNDSNSPPTTPDVARRVQIIEQRLMSREALLDLAERFHLFDGLAITPADQVGVMREAFTISAIAAAQQGFSRNGSLSALIVSAIDDDPDTAAAIANDLADALVRESVSDRQSEAQQALEFFGSEEARLAAAIAELEDQIALFRGENEEFMPMVIALRREERGRLTGNLLEIQQELSALRNEVDVQTENSQRAVTQRRILRLNEEIAQLTHQAGVLTARLDVIQDLMVAAPPIEQELIALNRRMEQLQAQLTAAADRRREAELGARIEVDQQAERFELLERALPPEYPVSRARKTVAMMGVVAGGMLGALLAYVLEWIQPVMRTAHRLERDLQLRPVISIPYSLPKQERRRRLAIWVLGIAVLVGAAVTMASLAGLF